jgi:hypothetical protein
MVARSRCPTEPVPDGDYIMRVGPRQPPSSTLRAAGLTDHVWTLQEVLMCRVPPWPQPHAV